MVHCPIWFSLTHCGEGWAANTQSARRTIAEYFPGVEFWPWMIDPCDPCTIVQRATLLGTLVAAIRTNVGEVAP